MKYVDFTTTNITGIGPFTCWGVVDSLLVTCANCANLTINLVTKLVGRFDHL